MLTFVFESVLNFVLSFALKALEKDMPLILRFILTKFVDKLTTKPVVKPDTPQPQLQPPLAEIAYRTPPQKTRIIPVGSVVEKVSSIADPPTKTQDEEKHDQYVKDLEAKVHEIATRPKTPEQHYEVMATPEELQEYEAKKAQKARDQQAKEHNDVKPS